jgi:hypothetical protein
MGMFRTLAIVVFCAVVLYEGVFALVWREELSGGAILDIFLIRVLASSSCFSALGIGLRRPCNRLSSIASENAAVEDSYVPVTATGVAERG